MYFSRMQTSNAVTDRDLKQLGTCKVALPQRVVIANRKILVSVLTHACAKTWRPYMTQTRPERLVAILRPMTGSLKTPVVHLTLLSSLVRDGHGWAHLNA